jgi:hypothetical protein
MLPLVKRYGKVAVCGSIASKSSSRCIPRWIAEADVAIRFTIDYNGEPMKLKNWREVSRERDQALSSDTERHSSFLSLGHLQPIAHPG